MNPVCVCVFVPDMLEKRGEQRQQQQQQQWQRSENILKFILQR
jgi:hypothetical protein